MQCSLYGALHFLVYLNRISVLKSQQNNTHLRNRFR